MSSKKTQTLTIKIIVTMDGCTVKQEFASDSKTTTSLGSKAHLENIKHCVLITVLLRHLKFQYNIKRAKENIYNWCFGMK